MASWNNNYGLPNWSGNGANARIKRLNVSSINADTITTKELYASTISTASLYSDVINALEVNSSTLRGSNIIGYNNYLDYIKNINLITNVITLDNQGLTATPGGLYLNGELIATPGSVSNISEWSKFKAETNVDMANSTIKNALGISSIYLSTSLINCDTIYAIGGRIDTLYGFDQINYPYARIERMSNDEIRTSSIYTNVTTSELIFNENEISTYSIYAQLGVYNTLSAENVNLSNLNVDVIKSRFVYAEDITASTIITNIQGVLADSNGQNGILFLDSNSSNGLINFDYNRSSLQFASENNVDVLSRFSTVIQSLSTIALVAPNITATTSNFTVEGDLIAPYVSTNIIDTLLLSAKGIGTDGLVINQILSNSGVSYLSSINTNGISSGSIVACNASFNYLTTNNILNTSNITTNNINTSNIDVSGNLVVDGSVTLNSGATINNIVYMNADMVFQSSNVTSIDYPDGLLQYFYDINNLRNLNVERITVLGGSTGNQYNIFEPFRNDSIVQIGENLLSPGQVTISGFNPDPFDSGIALTVDGDTQITQNLNVLGEVNVTGLTTIEGGLNVVGVTSVEGDLNVTGLATFEADINVTGLGTFQGAVNIAGALGVEGETNMAGAVTCEAGIGIAGAMGLTGGNVIFGSPIDTTHTFTNYGGTLLDNYLTVNGTTTFNGDVVFGGSIIFNDISANVVEASTIRVNTQIIYPVENNDGVIAWTNINGDLTSALARNELTSTLTVYSYDSLKLQALSSITLQTSTVKITQNLDFDLSGTITNLDLLRTNNIIASNAVGANTLYLYHNDFALPNIQFLNSNYDVLGIITYAENASTIAITSENIALLAPSTIYAYTSSVQVRGDVDISGNLFTNFLATSTMTSLSAYASTLSYTDLSNNPNPFPTYVGGQIQHWNRSGGYYDYYIPQLWYSDISNNSNCAIASDWSYYPAKNLNIDLSNNYITNAGGIFSCNYYVNQTQSNGSGYIDAGIVFTGRPGDVEFWQLIKPIYADLSGGEAQGTEGVYVVTRTTIDGSMTNKGRLYDDTIYTPWANVSDNLNMGYCNIQFTDQSTYIPFAIDFNNNFLRYTQIGYGSRYVAQDWSYFPAEHYVDLSFNDITQVGAITADKVYANTNFTYSNISQPIIQCGNGNTGSSGVTITLPNAYPSSNYRVQLTYHANPSGNKPLYHDSVTDSNFFVDGDSSADFDWCTFFVP